MTPLSLSVFEAILLDQYPRGETDCEAQTARAGCHRKLKIALQALGTAALRSTDADHILPYRFSSSFLTKGHPHRGK